jgi:hypothetical protein
MKIDSNKFESNIRHVCFPCGKAALKLPENAKKHQYSVSTMYPGVCDVCKKSTTITEVRDFMFPVFEV